MVVAHDSRPWIAEAVDSILAQTHPPYEVIVVCSGKDGTAEIAAGYGAPVRVVESEDRGPAHNRNVGVAEAGGELITFLDADDRWLPQKLERQVALLRDRPELGGCVTQALNVWDPEYADEAEHYRGHVRAEPIPGYATITLMVRPEAFERAGLLREELWYSDSAEWFLRARERGVEIELLPEVLVEHRMRAGNLTRIGADASKAEFLTLLRAQIAKRRAAAGE